MNQCNCTDYEQNIGPIVSAIITHVLTSRQDIKVFDYCPYCGGKLVDVEETETIGHP